MATSSLQSQLQFISTLSKNGGNRDLLGKTPEDRARLDLFESVFIEVSMAVKALFFNKDHENQKGDIFKNYKDKLEQVNKFVGGKDIVLGYLTIADYYIAEFSKYIETIYPEESKVFPFLRRIR